MTRNGATVAAFEREFASYVGAKYAIAAANGTATLQAALVALGVTPGDRVAVPPLTMSATTIAALNVGAVPVFVDVDPETWISYDGRRHSIGVSLYGLNGYAHWNNPRQWRGLGTYCPSVDDAAQALRKHGESTFTSYSFQASKILALGEGGMLCTNDEALAARARSYLSLGYRLDADQPRIDPAAIKSPTYERHHSLGINARMNDITATLGLGRLRRADELLRDRRECAAMYRDVIHDVSWLTPQFVPDGYVHDYWTYAVACDTPERALALSDAVVEHGGERPYAAWRLTYQEPAFKHLKAPPFDYIDYRSGPVEQNAPCCPVAESLQPRLLQFQTNNLTSAERNAAALRAAIQEIGA